MVSIFVMKVDQNVNSRSNKDRHWIIHSLGNPKGRTFDYFFCAYNIPHNFPYKLVPIFIS